ncbi:hypothetical protein DVH24_023100 [Malus domestica]|uniref:Uncharacterized protein n=1 Tax=Malus domestica TaxID=3750 RepID=A0A498KN63_MALDO|nr:hypothetical protein DVH24_023100 [Malus domestica]
MLDKVSVEKMELAVRTNILLIFFLCYRSILFFSTILLPVSQLRMAGKDTAAGHAIGIDLGTTYSCVAVWQYDHVEIIVNDQGYRTTPSHVAFTDAEILVGEAAFNQLIRNPSNSIFGESTTTVNNYFLGDFRLKDIPPAPRGVPKFNIVFDIDSNGILNVSAEDMLTGQKKGITLTNDTTCEGIERIIMAGKEGHAIGIDLGTTYSCVAVWEHERVEIIVNDQGNRTTPSCVAFTETERFVGDSAINQSIRNPTNSIFVTIKFPIYEGENPNTKNNNFLGQFNLEGIPPAPKGAAKFDVWFSIDANGILSVSAEDKSTGQRKGITIMSYKDIRNFEGIEALRMAGKDEAAGHAIGIDLGTTYSCVAVWQNDHVEIIVNDQGNRTTPSYVAFTNTERLIGDGAFNQVIKNPTNTIFAPRGVPKFQVCFDIDENGILHVSAEDMRLKNACEKAKRRLSFMSETDIDIDCLHQHIYYLDLLTLLPFSSLLSTILLPVSQLRMAGKDEAAGHAIGIDLGTTYSCVAVWQYDHMEIIVNDQGNRTTPSYVAFTNTERLIGDGAFNQVIKNPTNTIFGMFISSCTIPIYEGENRMARDNNYLGEITLDDIPPAPRDVPKFDVCFDIDENGILHVSAEDMSTGQKKGLTFKEQILHDPTRWLTKAMHLPRKDIFVISHFKIIKFVIFGYESLHTYLRGEDFDNKMVNFCVEQFKKKHNLDVSGNSKAPEEELNMNFFNKCMEPVKKWLKDANMKVSSDHDVVLAEFPKCNNYCRMCSRGSSCARASKAVAYGADIQAVVLSGNESGQLQDYSILDVMPLSLGVETAEEYCKTSMWVVIPRNSSIPIKRNTTLITWFDNQVSIDFPIYEGESTNTKNNNLLGQFTINGIPPAPKGTAEFDVCFSIDANGILRAVSQLRMAGKDTAAGHAIGMDLGTTYSCVAVWQYDHVEIIVNDQGYRTTPSHVAFTDAEILVGEAAFNQLIRNPSNSIFGESTTTVNNYFLGDFRLKDIPPAPRGVPKFNIVFDIDSNGILNVSAEDMLTGQKKGITLTNDTTCEGIERIM